MPVLVTRLPQRMIRRSVKAVSRGCSVWNTPLKLCDQNGLKKDRFVVLHSLKKNNVLKHIVHKRNSNHNAKFFKKATFLLENLKMRVCISTIPHNQMFLMILKKANSAQNSIT